MQGRIIRWFKVVQSGSRWFKIVPPDESGQAPDRSEPVPIYREQARLFLVIVEQIRHKCC